MHDQRAYIPKLAQIKATAEIREAVKQISAALAQSQQTAADTEQCFSKHIHSRPHDKSQDILLEALAKELIAMTHSLADNIDQITAARRELLLAKQIIGQLEADAAQTAVAEAAEKTATEEQAADGT